MFFGLMQILDQLSISVTLNHYMILNSDLSQSHINQNDNETKRDNIRQGDKLLVPRFRLDLFRRSFFVYGIEL